MARPAPPPPLPGSRIETPLSHCSMLNRRVNGADLTGTMAAILGVGSFTRRKALVLAVVFGSGYSDY